MEYYVYITTNLINNKKYIGKHYGLLEDAYIGSGKALKEAVSKYGKENFKKEIVYIGGNEEEVYTVERELIAHYNACHSKEYYNIAEGGEGGNVMKGWSEERMEAFKLKMKTINIGENNGMFGKKHSKETKNLLSELAKGRDHYNPLPILFGEQNGNYGNIGDKAKNGKKVYKMDDNKKVIAEFNTVRLALQHLGVTGHSQLYKAIREKTLYKGYYWKKD